MKRIFFLLYVCCTAAFPDAVWHCSRNKVEAEGVTSIVLEDQFSIASFNASVDVIGISINDLIDIYSGVPVRIGGLPLSACFMPSDQNLTSTALESLGLQPSATHALSRKNSIVQSNLFFVNTESQMLTCIAGHFPAVGYMSSAKNTNEVQPCF